MFDDGAKPHDFKQGQRVALHPATDLWMMGARFGTVAGTGRKFVGVKLDALRRIVKVLPCNLEVIE